MDLVRSFDSILQLRVILIGVALFSFFSCNNETKTSKNDLPALANDSVLQWIKKARDKNNLAEDRRAFLQKALKVTDTLTSDSLRLNYLTKIQWTYIGLNEEGKFRYSNRRAMQLASELKDSTSLAVTHWDLGLFLDSIGIKDSAFYHYVRAHKIYTAIGSVEKAGKTLYSMAQVQEYIKDFTGSEASAVKAVNLLKPLNENVELYRCYNLLGVLAKNLKEYDKSVAYYQVASEYLEKFDGPKRLRILIANNIGNVYKDQGLYDKAILQYEKVLKSPNLKKDYPKLYAKALTNMAESKSRIGLYANAESDLKKAIRIKDSVNDIDGMSHTHFVFSQYYLSQENIPKALFHANRALNLAKENSNNFRVLESLKLLIQIDPDDASLHGVQYARLNDSLQQEERQIRNKFARIQFETEEVEAQNILLTRQRQLWIGIAAGLLLLALSIFIIITERVKIQKLRFQQQQQETNNEIFSLMLAQKQKVEEGKQAEQRRISEELHDGVLGEMNGARMILVGLNKKADEAAVEMRSRAIEKLQEVQEEIRTISHELSDAAYQKFHNFIISIEELLHSVSSASSLKHTFTYDAEIEWDDLNAEIKINLYRIIQEGLMNCVKHAQADNISLDFKKEGHALIVKLKDDGKGFETKKGKKGIGHKNITSRLQKVKGSWEVFSKIGAGTEVVIKIPLNYSGAGTEIASIKNNALQKA